MEKKDKFIVNEKDGESRGQSSSLMVAQNTVSGDLKMLGNSFDPVLRWQGKPDPCRVINAARKVFGRSLTMTTQRCGRRITNCFSTSIGATRYRARALVCSPCSLARAQTDFKQLRQLQRISRWQPTFPMSESQQPMKITTRTKAEEIQEALGFTSVGWQTFLVYNCIKSS